MFAFAEISEFTNNLPFVVISLSTCKYLFVRMLPSISRGYSPITLYDTLYNASAVPVL